MRRFLLLLMPLFVVSTAVTAHADPITAGIYNLSDVFVDGFQLNGTLTLDGSGHVTAASITLDDSALGNPTFAHVDSSGGPTGHNPVADFAHISDSGVGQLSLSYLTALDGSGNIDLCILSANDCNANQASYAQIYGQSSFGYGPVDLSSGTLTPASHVSATPEPTSLILLGTGVLGAAFLMRRKTCQG